MSLPPVIVQCREKFGSKNFLNSAVTGKKYTIFVKIESMSQTNEKFEKTFSAEDEGEVRRSKYIQSLARC